MDNEIESVYQPRVDRKKGVKQIKFAGDNIAASGHDKEIITIEVGPRLE